MPFIRVWIHLIFSTKNREKSITPGLKLQLLQHIKENSVKKNITIDTLNCHLDHMHILFSLGATQTIANVSQLIKGESSFWINKERLTQRKFEWQDDYIAHSVSNSQINIVREYIRNQEEHHRIKTFEEECNEIFKKLKK